MILRRVINHVRKQEWTAIWIDLAIVVLGVVIGIQVANWNEQRATNRRAQAFTERLREDLRIEVWRYEGLNSYYRDVLANANQALDALEGRSSLSNEALLIAAYRATQYAEFGQSRASFDELISTGNIGLIKDLSLRKMATEIYGTKLYENVKNEGINSPYRVAFRMRIPIGAQTAVASRCGDRNVESGDFETLKNQLDYPCKTGLTQQEIDSAARTLRTDPEFVPLLRLRIANMNSAVSTQLMSQSVMASLKALSPGRP